MLNYRAEDDEAKKAVTDRLLEAWKRHPELRLGQLIYCASGGRNIFYDEDYLLLHEIEDWVSADG